MIGPRGSRARLGKLDSSLAELPGSEAGPLVSKPRFVCDFWSEARQGKASNQQSSQWWFTASTSSTGIVSSYTSHCIAMIGEHTANISSGMHLLPSLGTTIRPPPLLLRRTTHLNIQHDLQHHDPRSTVPELHHHRHRPQPRTSARAANTTLSTRRCEAHLRHDLLAAEHGTQARRSR